PRRAHDALSRRGRTRAPGADGFRCTVALQSQTKRHLDCMLGLQHRGVHMKKLFLGSVALVALGLGMPAFAAERPLPAAPAYAPAPVAAYTNWSGCYAGASAGASKGSREHFDGDVVGRGTNSFDRSGCLAAGQLGCSGQFGA